MRNEPTPSAAERAAEWMRQARESEAEDQQALADSLAALGLPTNVNTVARIERGDQPITAEQLLALAATTGEGLAGILRTPFTVGSVTVQDAADLRALLLGWDEGTPRAGSDASGRVHLARIRRREEQVARSLGTTPERVQDAATALGRAGVFGIGSVNGEVRRRVRARAEQDATPPDAPQRAYQSHAVRAVTKAIGDYLAGGQQ